MQNDATWTCDTHPPKEGLSRAWSTSCRLGFLRILSSLICQIWTFLSRFYLSPQWGPSNWWLLLVIFLTEENGCSPLCDSLKVLRGTVTLPLPYLQLSPGPATAAQGRSWAGKTGVFGLHSGQGYGQAHREGSWRTYLLYFTHSSFAIRNLCKKPPWPAPHTYRCFYLIHLGDIHAHLRLDSQMASSSVCRLGYRFTQVETCVNWPSLKASTCVKDSSA